MKTMRRAIWGITVVEIMVTLVVLGIILAVAAPSLADLLNRRRVMAVAEQLVSDFAVARAETSLRTQSVTVWFQYDNDNSCYTLSTGAGSGGNCQCAARPTSVCGTGWNEFKTTRVPSSIGVNFRRSASTNSGRFSINPPQMTVSQADAAGSLGYAVDVIGTRGSAARVVLSTMGRAKICTPNGSMPGVPAC